MTDEAMSPFCGPCTLFPQGGAASNSNETGQEHHSTEIHAAGSAALKSIRPSATRTRFAANDDQNDPSYLALNLVSCIAVCKNGVKRAHLVRCHHAFPSSVHCNCHRCATDQIRPTITLHWPDKSTTHHTRPDEQTRHSQQARLHHTICTYLPAQVNHTPHHTTQADYTGLPYHARQCQTTRPAMTDIPDTTHQTTRPPYPATILHHTTIPGQLSRSSIVTRLCYTTPHTPYTPTRSGKPHATSHHTG